MDEKLSYKFERLRERLRSAIKSGEITGKLPGERELARQFDVNAKTLSKALTDLAAEGLLDRSIGRGTFVRSSAPVVPRAKHRWIVLADSDSLNSELIRKLKEITPDLEIITDSNALRPSMLIGVEAVIDLSARTPQTLLRDLVVRGISVVMVGREPQTYSFNSVLVDVALGTSLLMRNLSLSGHRRFLCVESDGATILSDAARVTAQRFADETTVEESNLDRLLGSVKSIEATAVLCDSVEAAEAVREKLESGGLHVPRDVSVAAVGCGSAPFPASGYYVRYSQAAETIAELISRGAGKRPATIWLTGQFSDVHTVSAVRTHRLPAAATAGARDSLPA